LRSIISNTSTSGSSIVATSIDLRKTTRIVKGKKTVNVDRVMSIQEQRADEIGARPPYMYTSLCPDRRYRK
jgi:hypothetical protein